MSISCDIELTSCFLVVQVESCRNRFCFAEFQFLTLEISSQIVHVLVQGALQCISTFFRMHDSQVVRISILCGDRFRQIMEVDVEEEWGQDRSLWDATSEAS